MPELPDVEGFKAYFEKHALRSQITAIHAPDARILRDTSPQALGRRLKGEIFAKTHRHGKFLFAQPEAESGWMVMHFGMTGFLGSFECEDDEPEHASVVFEFEEGNKLAYASQRMLGRVGWVDDLAAFIEDQELGPDALSEDLSADRLAEILCGHRGMLKSALMNQAIVAGIGNEWSDEILFQCGLHPKVGIDELEFNDLSEVCRTGKRVLRTGSGARKNSHSLPHHYLGVHRHTDGKCPKCGHDLETVKALSRTAYFCPKCQKS